MATFDPSLKSKAGKYPVKLEKFFRGANPGEVVGYLEDDARFLVEKGFAVQVKPDQTPSPEEIAAWGGGKKSAEAPSPKS